MKLPELAVEAVRTRDINQVKIVVDTLRFKFGFKYKEIFDLVHNWTDVELSEWDQLLEDVDYQESLT